MCKYRKKPVVIEAIQLRKDNILQIESFIEGKLIQLKLDIERKKFEEYEDIVIKKGRKIETLEGTMIANVGDYIIKGVNGEFYPCKPDVFRMTYEKVEE